ncbi:hypothetical protein ECDEC6E_1850 [Escherichia coli DEC6E]|nr:hypothetical protein ECDEC6E_1850 [Escherichia coli DEC6E]
MTAEMLHFPRFRMRSSLLLASVLACFRPRCSPLCCCLILSGI